MEIKKNNYRFNKIVMGIAAAILTGLVFFAKPIEVSAEGRPVSITSCMISGDQVVCQLSAGSVPYGDDGNYYIYADEVWQDGPKGQAVARALAGRSVSVSFPLNYNTDSSNLSRKFLVAVKRGGQMVQVSDEHYITCLLYTSPSPRDS